MKKNISLLSILILSVCLFQSTASAGKNKYRKGLEGVWLITIETQQPAGQEFLPEVITLLGNFTKTGEFLSSSDVPTLALPVAPNLPPLTLEVGPGHGTWKRLTWNTYSINSWRLVKSTAPGGGAIGLTAAAGQFTLNRQEQTIEGTVSLQMTPFQGPANPAIPATLFGERVDVE